MDWTEIAEKKQKIRKMASGMLWADFKGVVLGWKGLVLALLVFVFIVMAYVKNIDKYNVGACFYFIMWVLIPLSSQTEKIFNYLPLSSNEVLYYLKYRANLIAAWTVVLYAVAGAVMSLLGVELFWERALTSMIMLLTTEEWLFLVTLYSYNDGNGKIMDSPLPVGKRVRFVTYNVFMVGTILFSMVYAMFMENAEKAKTVVLILAVSYLCTYVFRADTAACFTFQEYRKAGKRTIYATREQQDNKR